MSEDFYVGYRDRAPPRLARWLRAATALLIVGGCFLGGLWAGAQNRFDSGVFEFGAPRRFTGVVVMRPYPSLIVERPGIPGGAPGFSRYLLTGPGKQGADAIAAPWDGQAVQLTGALIYRDQQTLIKLDQGAIEALPADGRDHSGVALPGPPQRLGSVRVVGEIVDPQCYYGIMKPGFGVPHRSCAIRCLAGGVPPVLRVAAGRDTGRYYLLLGDGGEHITAALLPYVGMPIEVGGEVWAYGDLLTLRVRPGSLRAAALSSGTAEQSAVPVLRQGPT